MSPTIQPGHQDSPPDLGLWLLLGFDPARGVASRPVGVAGTDGQRVWCSWIPFEPAGAGWRDRLRGADGLAGRVDRLAYWAERANGVTLAAVAVAPPADTDLVEAVEAVCDELLAAGGGEG